MKTSLILETKDARRLNRRDLSLRTPAGVESYFSPLREIECQCSTAEREECERDQGREICASDVLEADAFAVLCTWLKDNAALKLHGVFRS
jgi:hypothetical protein